MKTKFVNLFDALRTSFWFVPALMVAAAVLLAWGTVYLDYVIDTSRSDSGWYYTGGTEGARSLLSTIAGSMISVASITFSVTIVALTLTSSQFGPRLLRNFMRDTGNQITLGTFIATFVYCLLVLRTIRSNGENFFVPHVSVTVALAVALASLGVLIYFMHHVASAIQANSVIAAVGAELDRAVVRLFPPRSKHREKERKSKAEAPHNLDANSGPIVARRSGYVVAIDNEGLLRLAMEKDLIFCVGCRAGDFVAQGKSFVTVWPKDRIDDELLESINDAFVLSEQGSPQQDVEFAIHQLVEIAVRALSPGINDPYTAMTCVDQLAVSLCRIAEQDMPPSEEYDVDGKIRLILKPITFAGIIDAAFNQIRQYGGSSVAVTIRLLEALAIVAPHVRREEDRLTLKRHATMVERGSHVTAFDECDRKDIDERYQVVLEILAGWEAFSHPAGRDEKRQG